MQKISRADQLISLCKDRKKNRSHPSSSHLIKKRHPCRMPFSSVRSGQFKKEVFLRRNRYSFCRSRSAVRFLQKESTARLQSHPLLRFPCGWHLRGLHPALFSRMCLGHTDSKSWRRQRNPGRLADAADLYHPSTRSMNVLQRTVLPSVSSRSG